MNFGRVYNWKNIYVDYTNEAKEDIRKLKNTGNKILINKLKKLLKELKLHPKTGTGKVKFLKHKKRWSRRINDEHRLVYKIKDDVVVVLVLSAFGHYEDN